MSAGAPAALVAACGINQGERTTVDTHPTRREITGEGRGEWSFGAPEAPIWAEPLVLNFHHLHPKSSFLS